MSGTALLRTGASAGTRVLAGMSWMFAGNVLSRLAALGGQVALGWLLLPADFGAYAFAISIAAVVAAIRNGGITQVMVQRGSAAAADVGLFFTYSLAFNLLAMAVLFAAAIPLWLNDSPSCLILCSMAVAIPLGTPSVLFKAQLTVEGRFKEVARIALASALVWQVSIVGFACLGWGALSFVLPPVLQALYENIAGWSCVRQWPSLGSNRSRQEYLRLFRETRWLMLSAALLAPATGGTYFVVALFNDAAAVGIYFFAFQLVVALGSPVYGAVEAVLPSTFVKLASDPARQVDTYRRMIRAILLVSLPGAVAVAALLPMAMHLVWQSKWNDAAPLAQVLTACVPAWILIATGRSLIEARGWWRMRFVIVGMYGIGGMAAAVAGAIGGGLSLIAECVTGYYVAFAALFLVYLSRQLKGAARSLDA